MAPVSAGEICTMAKAKELGLYDEDREALIPGLENMRTYTAANPNDYKKNEALCRLSGDGAFAYPLCPIQQGFAFTQVPGDPSRCQTRECPTGFLKGSNETCRKPFHTMFKNKKTQCDEKPTDWFSIPYYHLGNGFQKGSDGKCYRPCEGSSNEVPLVERDPVDSEPWNLTFTGEIAKTDGTRCTALDGYFGGKYAAADPYCPLAVIQRLSTTTSNLNAALSEAAKANMGELYDRLPSSMKVRVGSRISSEVSLVESKTKTNLKNIKPPTRSVKIACQRAAEPEDVARLYQTCRDFKDRPGVLLQEWRSADSGLTDSMVQTRRKVMTQACHEVFCNNPENAAGAGGEPLCFPVQKATEAELAAHNNRAQTVAALADGASGDTTAVAAASGKVMDSSIVNTFGKTYVKVIMGFLIFILTVIGFFIVFKLLGLIFGWNTANLMAQTRAQARAEAAAAMKAGDGGNPVDIATLQKFGNPGLLGMLRNRAPTAQLQKLQGLEGISDRLKGNLSALQSRNPAAIATALKGLPK